MFCGTINLRQKYDDGTAIYASISILNICLYKYLHLTFGLLFLRMICAEDQQNNTCGCIVVCSSMVTGYSSVGVIVFKCYRLLITI